MLRKIFYNTFARARQYQGIQGICRVYNSQNVSKSLGLLHGVPSLRPSQINLSHQCQSAAALFCTSGPLQPIQASMENETSVNEVSEGQAKVVLPSSVFYNPVQEYNRDLTIAVISEVSAESFQRNCCKAACSEESGHITLPEAGKSYANGISIFEGLAASGLRSVRFGLEIPGVKEVIANDFDKTAVTFIERNIEKNNIGHIVKAKHGDAAMVMYEHRQENDQFDVIDLDPYGSPTIFLDAAVQAVKDGGLLCVTCTDAAVLCGNAPEKCSANYGAMPLRSKFCHEMAVRIILQSIDSHANRYSRYIVPLVSLSVDFYFRVFVRVHVGQKQVKHSIAKKSMVFECVGCGTYTMQPLAEVIPTKGEGNFKFLPGSGPVVSQTCQHCHHHHRMGGPIWSAPIHDNDFVARVIARVQEGSHSFHTAERIIGMLNVALEELPDVPLYYVLDTMCGVLHCSPPRMKVFRSALLNAGYRVSLSHAAKNSYKTDAPMGIVWDVMRAWVKDNPINTKRLTEGSVVKTILDQPQTCEVSFQEHADANPQSKEKGLLRWQTNPEPFWGPKAKAKRKNKVDLVAKQASNQGKTKRSKVADVSEGSNGEDAKNISAEELHNSCC